MFEAYLQSFSHKEAGYNESQLGKQITIFNPSLHEISDFNLIILGVPEGRGAAGGNFQTELAPDVIRQALYSLYTPDTNLKILDAGNIKTAETSRETAFGLSTILNEFLPHNVPILILGGSQDMTYGQHMAYKDVPNGVHGVVIDESIDLLEVDEDSMTSDSFVWQIMVHEPNFLTRYTHLAHQTYFVNPSILNTIESFGFDCVRLGEVRQSIRKIEPILRSAHWVSVDIGVVKSADAPGRSITSPNGLYSEEICQLARYAGISDTISTFGVYDYNPAYDAANNTAQLVAQLFWCFIDGLSNRKLEVPSEMNDDFFKYLVDFDDMQLQIQFWKSKKTERWWLEIPEEYAVNGEKTLQPCNYEDYQTASQGELPEPFIKAFRKM